jgi:hypothetical protein
MIQMTGMMILKPSMQHPCPSTWVRKRRRRRRIMMRVLVIIRSDTVFWNETICITV